MLAQQVGKRIKELREKTGLSQEKFALECGLDRTYINSLEHGRRNITLESLKKILDILNISFKDFFDSSIF